MDPSIAKFMEDDEDESLHSGADVEAFSAALTRDIGADPPLQNLDHDSGLNSQPTNPVQHLLEQWKASNKTENSSQEMQKIEDHHMQSLKQHLFRTEQAKQELSSDENDKLTVVKDENKPTEKNFQHLNAQQQSLASIEENRLHNSPHLSTQQMLVSGDAISSARQAKHMPTISFHMLIPILRPHLDKDRSMQLQAIFSKLRNNEISKDDFLRVIRNIVGDQMLRQAVQKLQLQGQPSRNPPANPNLYSLPENSIQKSREADNKFDGKAPFVQPWPASLTAGKLQTSQTPFPMYGTTPSSFQAHSFPRLSIGAQTSTQKPLIGMPHLPKHEMQVAGGELKRIHGSSVALSQVKPEVIDLVSEPLEKSHLTVPGNSSFGISEVEQNEQMAYRLGVSTPMTSAGGYMLGAATISDGSTQISSLMSGNSVKTPLKKHSAWSKKPWEAPGTSPPSSKKQKTSGTFHDQSIDQLNDVTAVSGVNLREEEEQLLCAPREESRPSEASRRVAQEEEERLILHRGSLQKKLAEITSKCGIKSIGGDVERCLSMCVEERLRGLLSCLIKLAKQRAGNERSRHRFVVTSDVGRQILSINKKIKDDWDRKQANEAEKLRKANDVDIGETDKDKDKEKDEARLKATKANKEEDDKMRATAANVAARVAVGGDDMLSKWQLMAEQARQKREGLDGDPPSQTSKASSNKSMPSLRKSELLESDKKSLSASLSGHARKHSRIQPASSHIKVPHSISVKDLISALEREPQMTKSSFLYRLYERKVSVSTPEHQATEGHI